MRCSTCASKCQSFQPLHPSLRQCACTTRHDDTTQYESHAHATDPPTHKRPNAPSDIIISTRAIRAVYRMCVRVCVYMWASAALCNNHVTRARAAEQQQLPNSSIACCVRVACLRTGTCTRLNTDTGQGAYRHAPLLSNLTPDMRVVACCACSASTPLLCERNNDAPTSRLCCAVCCVCVHCVSTGWLAG